MEHGRGRAAEARSGQACAEHLHGLNLHTLPNAQHMSRLQKALGRRGAVCLAVGLLGACQRAS